MLDALAGIEFDGTKPRLGGVGIELLLRETERVLGVGLIQCIADDGERRGLVRPVAKPEVRGVALSRAVIAESVGVEARKVAGEIGRAGRTREVQSSTPGAVLIVRPACLELRLLRVERRKQVDHATRGVAVKSGERTAQDLDAVGPVEIEESRLALPIGHGERYVVLEQAHAAYAEGGTRAEAARGDLQVLGIVVAILHDDAGDTADPFGEVHVWPVRAQRVSAHGVYRRRNVVHGLFDARRRDDQGLAGLRVPGVLCAGRGRGQDRDAGADQAFHARHDEVSLLRRSSAVNRNSRCLPYAAV